MKQKNNHPDFRSKLKLPKVKTEQGIEKLAFNEKVTGSELVSALYTDVGK